MPFQSSTTDASWQRCVDSVLRKALERFRPELLVTQHGADPHREDPLADLALTTDSFRFAAELSRELADRFCEGRWVATGGGGYQPVRVLPRAWGITWAAVSGRQVPDAVDAEWLAAWQRTSPAPLCPTFLDPPLHVRDEDAAARANDATLTELLRIHSL
jgi:acetoin utilization protein AcuC